MLAMPTTADAHLATALTDPLDRIEPRRPANQSTVEGWLCRHGQRAPAPLHVSVNLRNTGFKLAPAGIDLFPVDFNKSAPRFQPLCAHRTLIVPESHTRNPFYLESLATLRDLLVNVGRAVSIGSLRPVISAATLFDLPSGRRLTLAPLESPGPRLGMAGFAPRLILLSNARSSSRPTMLEGLWQPGIPPLTLGWTKWCKSSHFVHYRRVAKEFCELIHIDPWLIRPLHRDCEAVNRKRRAGEKCLTGNVSALLAEIRLEDTATAIGRQPCQSGSLPRPRCRFQSFVCPRHGCSAGAADRRPRTRREHHYREGLTR